MVFVLQGQNITEAQYFPFHGRVCRSNKSLQSDHLDLASCTALCCVHSFVWADMHAVTSLEGGIGFNYISGTCVAESV